MRGGIQHETLTSGLPQPHAPLGRAMQVLECSMYSADKTIVSIAEKRCQRVPEKVHRKCIESLYV